MHGALVTRRTFGMGRIERKDQTVEETAALEASGGQP
jgi:hypothetical protein